MIKAQDGDGFREPSLGPLPAGIAEARIGSREPHRRMDQTRRAQICSIACYQTKWAVRKRSRSLAQSAKALRSASGRAGAWRGDQQYSDVAGRLKATIGAWESLARN